MFLLKSSASKNVTSRRCAGFLDDGFPPLIAARHDTMSDLILTIDSDDEQQARRAPLDTLSDGEGGGTAAKGKGKGKGKAKQQAEVAKQKKGKGKKRAREGEDDGEDEDGGALGRAGAGQEDRLAAGFTFDALGGGEMSSRRHGKKDAWVRRHTKRSSP